MLDINIFLCHPTEEPSAAASEETKEEPAGESKEDGDTEDEAQPEEAKREAEASESGAPVGEEKGEEKSSRRNKGGDDWELWHNSGLCHAYLKQYDEAIQAFERANANQRHDATFLQLGKVHEDRGDPTAALRVYQDALDFSPENPELLTTMGFTFLFILEC